MNTTVTTRPQSRDSGRKVCEDHPVIRLTAEHLPTDHLSQGTRMEYLDLCDENGLPTGTVVSRPEAHALGLRHRTAHVWILRQIQGRCQILLQKRSMKKESFPGLYDASAAGHIAAGDEPRTAMLRELAEELGIYAKPEQLIPLGKFSCQYEEIFQGTLFRDNEVRWAFLYTEFVNTENLQLQSEEVERVDWFDLQEVREEIRHSRDRICVTETGLDLLLSYLKHHPLMENT